MKAIRRYDGEIVEGTIIKPSEDKIPLPKKPVSKMRVRVKKKITWRYIVCRILDVILPVITVTSPRAYRLQKDIKKTFPAPVRREIISERYDDGEIAGAQVFPDEDAHDVYEDWSDYQTDEEWASDS